MIVLYTPDADAFTFSKQSWDELLSNAVSYGWKPKGTVAPPKEFNLLPSIEINAWDGDYAWPRGQTVPAKDSEALEAAVQRALADRSKWKLNSEQHLLLFSSFCRYGGFLISQPITRNPLALQDTVLFPPTNKCTDVDSWKLAS